MVSTGVMATEGIIERTIRLSFYVHSCEAAAAASRAGGKERERKGGGFKVL